MKQQGCVVAVLVTALVAINVSIAENLPKPDTRFTAKNLTLIEKNIDIGLDDTHCPGLQESAAAVLHEVESYAPDFTYSASAIPLMSVLDDHQANTSTRILAAVALHGLNSPEGNYDVEMTGKDSRLPLLRRICAMLSNDNPPPLPQAVASLYRSELGVNTVHKADPRFTVRNLGIVDENIAVDLRNSTDRSVRKSAVKTLYELESFAPAFRFPSSVIPLLAIVKNHNEQLSTRLMAIRDLHGVHSPEGDFTIERMAKLSKQTQIRILCARLSGT